MKRFLFCAILALLTHTLYAQQEPDFIGEVNVVKNSETNVTPLAKESINAKIKSFNFNSFGYADSRFSISGGYSATQFDVSDKLKFIIRSIDQNIDPLSFVKIIRMDEHKDKREYIFASASTFTSSAYSKQTVEHNTNGLVEFTAKKYGQHSYILELINPQVGEYVIITADPNNIKESSNIISTFGLKRYYNEFVANRHNPEYVKQFLDRTVKYLIDNNLKPIRPYKTSVKKTCDTFCLLSGNYIEHSKFLDIYGSLTYFYLIDKYQEALELERKKKRRNKTTAKTN